MERRKFLKSIGALTIGLSSCQLLKKSQSKRPNVLLILSDDHSLQALSAYKGRMRDFIKKHEITPNIDKIASQGTIFENSFVGNSICGPSRASILTGKHSHINGFKANGDKFDPHQWTVAKELQKVNYQTAAFGKWHLGTLPTGFDDYNILPGQGKYYNPDFISKGYLEKIRKQGYVSDIIGDMTIDWLEEKRDDSKPFFLCSWHKAPHRTWMPHPRHFNLLEGIDVPEPKNLFDDYKDRTSLIQQAEMSIRDEINLATDVKVTPPVATTPIDKIKELAPETKYRDPATFDEFKRMTEEQKKVWDEYYVPRNEEFGNKNLKGKDLTRWKYQAYLKDYLKCIKALDENVGRVLDYLKENDLEENTIVIYSSDQGFYNGEHGWFDKRWMYEESLRNPLIIKWPEVTKPGSRREEMVQNIDYAPTILDAAGISPNPKIQGKSFLPMLKGKKPKEWRDNIFYTYYGKGAHAVPAHRGVRNERYKLIEFYTENKWEFYDLKKDHLEMHNKYNDPAYQNIISDMKKDLKKLEDKYNYQLE